MSESMRSVSRYGFTIIELLIVVAIIGVLASYVLADINQVRDEAYATRAQAEFDSFRESIEMYVNDHGQYPPDADRDIPAGLETYLQSQHWPDAPWPGGVYDWDNWTIGGDKVIQLSIRFCEMGDPGSCQFPDEPWASDFQVNSAAYFCLQGDCRAHSNEPESYPGHCFNCDSS